MTVTREGQGLLLTMVLIGLAALNTGNNLVYLMLALMLALFLLDLLEGWRNLRPVSGTVTATEPVYANEPAEVRVRLTNRSRRPLFLLRLTAAQPPLRHVVSRLEPRAAHDETLTVRFPRRGQFNFEQARLASAYPFGFFQFSRKLSAPAPVLVYPELVDAHRLLGRIRRDTGSGSVPAPAGEDFSDIRPYRPGDRMRDIHWKATAKTGDLMVRELRVGIAENMTVILDGRPGEAPERFERAVSIAASLIHLLFSAGYPVRLACAAGATGFIHEKDQLYRAMDLLAVVQPDDSWTPRPEAAGPDVRLVVTAGTAEQVPVDWGPAEVLDADSV